MRCATAIFSTLLLICFSCTIYADDDFAVEYIMPLPEGTPVTEGEPCEYTCNGVFYHQGEGYIIAQRCAPSYNPQIYPLLVEGWFGWRFPSCTDYGYCRADGCESDVAIKRPRCPAGYDATGFRDGKCHRINVDPNKNNCCDVNNGSNPIHTALGAKLQHETDFVISQRLGISFERYYTSAMHWQTETLGDHWRHSLLRRIWVSVSSSGATAMVYRGNGDVFFFNRVADAWVGETDVKGRLIEVTADGVRISWTYTEDDTVTEQYNAAGDLIQITSNDGGSLTLGYYRTFPQGIGRITRIVDEQGRSWNFNYDAIGNITRIDLPDGQQYRYEYDENGMLSRVYYPDLTPATTDNPFREYRYGESTNATDYFLTGIIDENGSRYATWAYDPAGRAVLSVHGDISSTIDRVELTYHGDIHTDPSATVTSRQSIDTTRGVFQERTYGFRALFGVTKPASISQPCVSCGGDTVQSKTYDGNGYPDHVTDFNGTVTDVDYNARGLEIQRIEPLTVAGVSGTPAQQRTTQTDWHPTLRVPTEKRVYDAAMALKSRITWTYNSRGQTLTRTQFDPIAAHPARTLTYAYCESADVAAGRCPLVGLLTQIDGPRTEAADTTSYSYRMTDDASCGRGGACLYRRGDLWRVTNALGQISEMVSYDKNGRVTRSKDANGTLTDLIYHPRGWLLSRTVRANADGSPSVLDATTTFAYDAVGNVTRTTQPDGAYLSYSYDNAHRLTDITDNLNNRIHYTLDDAGNHTREDTLDPTGVLKRTLSRTYNALNRLQQTTDALSRTTTFAYDANGNRTDQTDPLGVRTHSTFDALNRLQAQVQDYLGTDPDTANATTAYTYDALDSLTQVNDPTALATAYSYDGQGNLTQLQSPDTGTTTSTQDAVGNRITQTDARGVVGHFTYDALNRLTGIHYPSVSRNIAYVYDESNGTTGCSISYPAGRLTRMIDSSGSTVYCYDWRGNVIQKIQVTGTSRFSTGYAYNLADRLMRITYPSGLQANYARDAVGRISAISVTPQGGSATPILNSLAYLPFGPANSYTFAQSGQTLSKSYDQNYNATDITGNALTLHFRRDAVGNIDRLGTAAGATTPIEQYQYDAHYRLQQVNDGASGLVEGYTYNTTGDRLTKIQPSTTQTYTYTPSSHHLDGITGNARSLDANGNTIQTTGAATLDFAFDDRNRMIEVRRNGSLITTYDYNAKGERVYKTTSYPTSDARWFSYNESGQLLGEYTQTGLREYVWADGTPIAILDTMGVPLTPAELIFTNGFDNAVAATTMTYYVHTDQLDTPRVVTTTTGTVVWNWPWAGNPFGEAAPNIQTMTMNLRFPGQYYDQETELNYNYFRDYEPNTGRYVESDPIGLQGGLTTYSYVNSQPLRSTDSKGLVKCGCYSGGPGFRLITGTDRIGDAICDFWCTCSCPRKNAIAEKFSFGFSMNIGNSDRATCLNISFAVTTDSIFDGYLNPNTPPRIAQDELEKNAKKHCTTCGYWNE